MKSIKQNYIKIDKFNKRIKETDNCKILNNKAQIINTIFYSMQFKLLLKDIETNSKVFVSFNQLLLFIILKQSIYTIPYIYKFQLKKKLNIYIY